MGDYYDEEIERLHEELAGIYRRGRLTATEDLAVKGLWARIERLEAARVAVVLMRRKRAFELLGTEGVY